MIRTHQTLLAIACAAIAWQLAASTAFAQFGTDRINRPISRPTVSPYVNMLRGTYGSNSAAGIAANYYGAVRPQQQFYAQSEHLTEGIGQLQMRQNQSRQNDQPNGQQNSMRKYRMNITGHPASFLSFGGASGSGAGGGGQGNSGGGGGGGFGGNSFGGQGSTGGFSGHSVGFGSNSGSSGVF